MPKIMDTAIVQLDVESIYYRQTLKFGSSWPPMVKGGGEYCNAKPIILAWIELVDLSSLLGLLSWSLVFIENYFNI